MTAPVRVRCRRRKRAKFTNALAERAGKQGHDDVGGRVERNGKCPEQNELQKRRDRWRGLRIAE